MHRPSGTWGLRRLNGMRYIGGKVNRSPADRRVFSLPHDRMEFSRGHVRHLLRTGVECGGSGDAVPSLKIDTTARIIYNPALGGRKKKSRGKEREFQTPPVSIPFDVGPS